MSKNISKREIEYARTIRDRARALSNYYTLPWYKRLFTRKPRSMK